MTHKMNNEVNTVLTCEQIDQIVESLGDLRWALVTKTERFVLFARAIEQAVLQSPEVQALRDALEEMMHRAHPADVVGDFPRQKLIEAREHAPHSQQWRKSMTEPIKLPPLPPDLKSLEFSSQTLETIREWGISAIEADRQEWDTRTSRSVDQLKESLLNRNQRFVATHSEVKNLIEYYEADRQTTDKQLAAYKRLTESLESRVALLQNQYDELKKAADPSLLESERAANALLTQEVEALEADRQARGDPTPPKDAACFDDWVTASDVDGVVYDGPSFERGYQCGKIAELDRLTGHAPEWPDFARMEACLHRLKERLVFENSRRNDLEQKLRKKRNG